MYMYKAYLYQNFNKTQFKMGKKLKDGQGWGRRKINKLYIFVKKIIIYFHQNFEIFLSIIIVIHTKIQ